MALAPPRDAANRIPPHNIDAEQSVLGAMLESKEAIANVVEVVDADDFYKPAHGEIYDAILSLHTRGEAPDAITVAEELARRGKLDYIGGRPYILGLIEAYPTASSAKHYARIVEEHALLRRLISAGNEIQEIGFSLPEVVDDAVDQAEEIIYSVGDRRLRDDIQPVRPLLTQAMIDIETLYDRGESVTGLASGFTDLDEMTSGFQPSNLIIVAARPAMGKSSLLNDFALNTAMRQNVPVVIFSLEMSRHEIVKRFLASESRVDAQRLNKGSLQEQDWTRLSSALGRLAETPIFIDDSANITLMEMRAKCRRLKAKHGLGLVIIDYLQLMQSPRKSENRQQEVSEISRSLKIMAKELNLPVICASQLNRGVEYRSDKRPFLGDLRESGCLTADTRIARADTGEWVTMGELYSSGARNIPVWTLNDDLKIERGNMTHVFSSGVKMTYRLKLRSGREIKASANHPFLSFDGWKPLGELTIGERIAIPRTLPEPSMTTPWPDEHVILLAHMIGDGSCLRRLPTRYASMSQENLQAVADSAKAFGVTARIKFEPEARSYQLFMPSPYRVTHGRRNPIVSWMDSLGLYDKRSHEKFIPKEIFSLPKRQIALFLRHLWATDGYIGLKPTSTNKTPTIYYASTSRRLVEDVAGLLLRFGIVVRLGATSKGNYRDMNQVYVTSGEMMRAFVEEIGAFGPKIRGLHQVTEYISSRVTGSNRDTIPEDIWQRFIAVAGKESIKSISAGIGVGFNPSFSRYSSPRRSVVQRLAEYFDDSELRTISNSDVYWDSVREIEELGEEEVFDATVPGNHNFVADGMLPHNSIEQDSDMVMFIYRDEVYNPDSPNKGEAELIVAKHRNGPTGTCRLAFMNQYTKFANIAKGPGI
ncbi:MAG TPA: replicative DNA helicase [Actinomycetota bacterium]|nr:replicative DNA helicase [Actinomycetota bacterium]